jgi:hypothetical protein
MHVVAVPLHLLLLLLLPPPPAEVGAELGSNLQ